MKAKTKKIYVTETDMQRLKELVRTFTATETRDKKGLMLLQQELERAQIVTSKKVSQQVVTMNSKVKLLNLSDDKEMTIQVVYPWEVNVDEGKISVLSPIGTAILGYKVGDTIEWMVPVGMRKLRIEEILYQPEASGNYNE